MKKLDVNFDGIHDSTGYLFSFAKSLSAAVKNSIYAELSEDVIASSGFAFRMWVAKDSLCPSAMSIWGFDSQKPWVGNSGLLCVYTGRYRGQDDIEEERRLAAIGSIKKSIDGDIAAISWDISGCEWGLITGYDDEKKILYTLKTNGSESEIPYDVLGKMELPLLSVLTIMGKTEKSDEEIMNDTMKLAVSHYSGEEWCDNAKGMEAYPALIGFIKEKVTMENSWNVEYYLGTYGALKYYAWKFFGKYGVEELEGYYSAVYRSWMKAFDIKRIKDVTDKEVSDEIADLLTEAYEAEKLAYGFMKKICK
jgi:hypothetical protein